jgi:tRNA-dependent cyclodipeptide synthase
MIEVVETYGMSDFKRPLERGMLLISLGSSIFSKQRVLEYVQFGLTICREFSVVMVDHPARHNWPLSDTLTPSEYHQRFMTISVEKASGLKEVLAKAGLGERAQVMSWTEFTEAPEYRRNIEVLTTIYEHDDSFRAAVTKQVYENIGGKLAILNGGHRTAGTQKIRALSMFLIEELSGIFYLQFDRGHTLDVFPAPQMEIVGRIYQNEFPHVSRALGYPWHEQVWMHIASRQE